METNHKQEFDELYQVMVNSKEVKNMQVFGESSHKIFNKLVDKGDLATANEWLDMFRAVRYKFYLTRSQADEILKPHHSNIWTWEQFESVARSNPSIILHEDGCYNVYALWVVINKLRHLHASVKNELKNVTTSQVKELFMFYQMAVEWFHSGYNKMVQELLK